MIAAYDICEKLFHGKDVFTSSNGKRYGCTSLTDFIPPVPPHDINCLAALMHAAVPSWASVDAMVGVGDRSGGCLTHLIALRQKLPYTLTNWYPSGSRGDIEVEERGGFTGGKGVVLLNGLSKGQRVVIVDDIINSGKNIAKIVTALQRHGIEVAFAMFACNIVGRGGMEMLVKVHKVPCHSLCTMDVTKTTTLLVRRSNLRIPRSNLTAVPTTVMIQNRPVEEMVATFQKILNSFVNVPIYHAENSDYPYCNFSLTDFSPLMVPNLVEDMADAAVYLSNQFRALLSPTPNPSKIKKPRKEVAESDHNQKSKIVVNLLVSESDRGGGPLTIAVALRTGLPFTMANWKGTEVVGAAKGTVASVGYSGHGTLHVNGISKGDNCIVVDDMISSGGTCEALIRAVEARGAHVVEAIFASEKVNTGGRCRLQKQWPNLRLLSMCYFIASGTHTKPHPPTDFSANNTPVQQLSNDRTIQQVLQLVNPIDGVDDRVVVSEKKKRPSSKLITCQKERSSRLKKKMKKQKLRKNEV